jgi:hypothetical protein
LEACAEQGTLLCPVHFGTPFAAFIEDGAHGFSAKLVSELV